MTFQDIEEKYGLTISHKLFGKYLVLGDYTKALVTNYKGTPIMGPLEDMWSDNNIRPDNSFIFTFREGKRYKMYVITPSGIEFKVNSIVQLKPKNDIHGLYELPGSDSGYYDPESDSVKLSGIHVSQVIKTNLGDVLATNYSRPQNHYSSYRTIVYDVFLDKKIGIFDDTNHMMSGVFETETTRFNAYYYRNGILKKFPGMQVHYAQDHNIDFYFSMPWEGQKKIKIFTSHVIQFNWQNGTIEKNWRRGIIYDIFKKGFA